GPLALDSRTPAAGHLGLALRLERSVRRTGRAAPGAANDPRVGAVFHGAAAATFAQSTWFRVGQRTALRRQRRGHPLSLDRAYRGGGPTLASRAGTHPPGLGRLCRKTAGHRPASHAELQQATNAPL